VIIFIVIIGVVFFIVCALALSNLFGDAFRTWNEGKDYDNKVKKYSWVKTFIIGFIIFILLLLYYSIWE